MAASVDDWACDSNKAIIVSLVRPDPSSTTLKTIHHFHPKFTYPIFGTEELIFGYHGLDIQIQFAAHDCRSNVSIKYTKKFTGVADVRPTECSTILREFMPPPSFEDKKRFENTLHENKRARTWTPPGERVHSYERAGRTFEVWSGSLLDINCRHQLDLVQIFVLFFIEGGQMLHLDDPDWSLDRWRVYFIYEKTQVPDAANISPYVLLGYGTTYRYWIYNKDNKQKAKDALASFPNLESINPTQQPCRLRISQVVILPPFQDNGHGSELYRLIYKHVMADNTVIELTVEDPSEEFDKLHDMADWKVLEPVFREADIQINTAAVSTQSRHEKVPRKKLLNLAQLEAIRKAYKIVPRQFYRCLELYFLASIPESHRASGGASLTKLLIKKHKNSDPIDVKYYWLRNLIKARIWRQNYDKLLDNTPAEVNELINDVTRGQENEYEGYLLRLAAKAVGDLNGSRMAGRSAVGGATRKRKIIDDDDDDEGAASDASKRARA